MLISLEEIISLVVKEVISELSKRGIDIDDDVTGIAKPQSDKENITFGNNYHRAPLMTESHVQKLNSSIKEIEIPLKTIITPSAQDLIKKRKIIIIKK